MDRPRGRAVAIVRGNASATTTTPRTCDAADARKGVPVTRVRLAERVGGILALHDDDAARREPPHQIGRWREGRSRRRMICRRYLRRAPVSTEYPRRGRLRRRDLSAEDPRRLSTTVGNAVPSIFGKHGADGSVSPKPGAYVYPERWPVDTSYSKSKVPQPGTRSVLTGPPGYVRSIPTGIVWT